MDGTPLLEGAAIAQWLGEQLSRAAYIVGDDLTIADVVVSGSVMWGRMVGASIADHRNVSRWVDACAARPSIQRESGGAA